MDRRDTIGIPLNTRLYRIDRIPGRWRIWTALSPCGRFGTFLLLHDDGAVERWTERQNGTIDIIEVRPSD